MDSLAKLMYSFFIIISFLIPGPSCLKLLHLRGPHAVRSDTQAWVELTCTFQHTMSESQQLDLKWYYSEEEEPFLQWVPSTGREPQIRGGFSSGMTVRHQTTNTTEKKMVEQVLRLERPSTRMSGDYTCRVATFTHEERKSHTLTIFDPGVGPNLRYSELNNQVNLSCQVEQVFPEPRLELDWDYDMVGEGARHRDKYSSEMTTTTIRKGYLYSVTVHTVLMVPFNSYQTIFSCCMEIPGTSFSLDEKTIFFPGTQMELKPRASQISGVCGGWEEGRKWLGWVSWAGLVWIISVQLGG